MKIVVAKNDLLDIMAPLVEVTKRKDAHALSSHVLLVAEDQHGLRLSVSQTPLSLSVNVDADVKASGSVAVSCVDFSTRIKTLPDGPVAIEAQGTGLVIRSVGHARRFTLASVPADDFPRVPTLEDAAWLLVPRETWQELTKTTRFAMSEDCSRPHMNGSLFVWKKDIVRLVATDGYRLATSHRIVEGSSASVEALLSRVAVVTLDTLVNRTKDEAFRVSLQNQDLFAEVGRWRLAARLIDAKFPPYEHVIPKKQPHTIFVGRDMLLDAMRSVSVASDERTSGVRMSIEPGKVRLESASSGGGDGVDEVPADYDGPVIKTAINGEYMKDVLAALADDEVKLSLADELSPLVLQDKDERSHVSVIMPMRV